MLSGVMALKGSDSAPYSLYKEDLYGVNEGKISTSALSFPCPGCAFFHLALDKSE